MSGRDVYGFVLLYEVGIEDVVDGFRIEIGFVGGEEEVILKLGEGFFFRYKGGSCCVVFERIYDV